MPKKDQDRRLFARRIAFTAVLASDSAESAHELSNEIFEALFGLANKRNLAILDIDDSNLLTLDEKPFWKE